ncbi:MAG: FtsX-like permease family protein, partial [Alphaproteobacteria bacterium]
RLSLFLTLVGLTALLIGGIGVGNAVKNHLDGKTSTIAVLKCLGATTALVFRIYLIEVMAVAGFSIAMGLALGAAVPALVVGLTADLLPGALASAAGATGLHVQPLGLAAIYGILTALAFTLWPLAKIQGVSAAQLFRSLVAPLKPWPPAPYVVAVLAAVAGLVALAYLSAPRPTLALWFILATAAVLLVLQGTALGLGRAARAAGVRTQGRRWPLFHLACANLHRPGSTAGLIVLSLGVGLTVVTTVVQIEGNLRQQIRETVPARAPSFYFIDIQPDQAKAFDKLVTAIPGIGEIRRMPSLRARITHINGTSVKDATVAPGARWAVRGDRGLSYARHPPPHTRITAGAWWPPDYSGKPLISLGRHIARGFGVGVGDSLSFNILGRNVTATIANLRDIDWSSLAMNFTIVFAPGTLEAAPQTHIATVKAETDAEDALQRAVTTRFANVTAIRVKDALDDAARVLTGIATAAAIVTAVVLVAGILVLGGAIAASHQRRIYDAAVLKVLGMRRRQMFAVFIIEYAAIGLITGLVAAIAGSAAAYAVLTHVMHTSWTPLPTTLILTISISMIVILSSGFAGTWRALGEKTAPVLRRHHSMRGN